MNEELTPPPAESDPVANRGEKGNEESAEKGPSSPARRAKPKPQLDTIEDLLQAAYRSKTRLLVLSKEGIRKLPVIDDQIGPQTELADSLLKADTTLNGTFKLLHFVAFQGVQLKESSSGDLANVLGHVAFLVVVALSHHPVFGDVSVQLLNPLHEPSLSTSTIRDLALQMDAEKLGLAPEQFTQADKERLVENAVACFGFVRALQREWSLDQYIDETYDSAWKYETPEAVGIERAAAIIGASREQDVLGLVASTYLARISRLEREVSRLEREAVAAANRESRLKENLHSTVEREETALARAEAFSADIVRLSKELAAERDSRVVDKSHMADDYETLRTRIIRRLGGEIDLLTDGLHALRNGAPAVAEEFLDRSLLALAREVEQLKDAAGGLA